MPQPNVSKNQAVYAQDVTEEQLSIIKTLVGDAFEATPSNGTTHQYGDLATRIRGTLDAQLETKGWSVVVGRAFGASVTHQFKGYVYLSVFPGVTVLCFRV